MFETYEFRFSALPPMDSDLPYDVDSVVWPFPTSCSLGSDHDCEGLSSGGKFSSTGTIPILLCDGDDVGDQLESDSATPNTTGRRVVQDRNSSAILKLGILAASSAVHASFGERLESSRGWNEGNGFNWALTADAVDGGPPSGSADDRREDVREKKVVSDFLNAEPERRHTSSSRHSRSGCHCRPSPSRSNSLGCMTQTSATLLKSGSQNMRRSSSNTYHGGSCCASPAAITNAPLIAAAKHEQNFALEDLQICHSSPNSFVLYDCAGEPPNPPPLTANHDLRLKDQQHQFACRASSSTLADLSIDFPPRDRMTDHGFPPPYSPSIEPSSSSSSSNSNLPHHLAWLQDATISLSIDQESFRAVLPAFKLVGYTNLALPIHPSRGVGIRKPFASGNDLDSSSGSPMRQRQQQQQQHSDLVDQASMDPDSAGMAEFMPVKRESFVFHHSTLDPPPSIRRLSVNGDESRDHLSQYAYLGIKSSGGFQIYVARGSETRRGPGVDVETMTTTTMTTTTAAVAGGRSSARVRGSSAIKLEWRFEYAVEDKRKADGTKAGNGEKFLTPLRFSCSPELLHPKQGRKVTVLSVWKKSLQPRVVASRLEPLTIPSPTTHNLSGPLSSPTSPKGAGVSGLWFPSASRLWGRRTKNSPYPFDKGSDGSEEELIPSEGSAKRRRRRPTSAYVPRASLEAEWPLLMWDRDRGQSADPVWQANDRGDARPATAGGGEGRNRAQSFGRGAASEGENDRLSSRSRGAISTSRRGYSRRPRTAR